jgi:hypothetical protein
MERHEKYHKTHTVTLLHFGFVQHGLNYKCENKSKHPPNAENSIIQGVPNML